MADPAPSARLEARGLVVERQGKRVLDGADLTVDAATIAVIEGASGSGKSTLLRALSTLVPVTAGSILLDGVDATQMAPSAFRRRVAFVAQDAPMLEGTVADNLGAGPRLAGDEPTDEALVALLERVGLSGAFLERPARELSGGEKQRVALARALANDPEILLLDEPTAALDPSSAARVVEFVRELVGLGLGLVVVTHAEEQARALEGTRYRCADGRITPRD